VQRLNLFDTIVADDSGAHKDRGDDSLPVLSPKFQPLWQLRLQMSYGRNVNPRQNTEGSIWRNSGFQGALRP
jgi:hypothetical protein